MHELLRERLVEDMTLQRLSAADVAALLEGRAGQTPPKELVQLIFSETEGNPFFVEELYRHLDEADKLFTEDGKFRSGVSIADTEVPRGVRLIIEHRLAKVSEACRKLLTAGAVAGRVVSFDLLSRIGDLADDPLFDALDEAASASVMEEIRVGREARYQFVHEQIRQTLISALSLPRRISGCTCGSPTPWSRVPRPRWKRMSARSRSTSIRPAPRRTPSGRPSTSSPPASGQSTPSRSRTR